MEKGDLFWASSRAVLTLPPVNKKNQGAVSGVRDLGSVDDKDKDGKSHSKASRNGIKS